jgi:hypothetical protein
MVATHSMISLTETQESFANVSIRLAGKMKLLHCP